MIVLLVCATGAKKVKGVPIKIGVLEHHFAATLRWSYFNSLPPCYDVTHIPSGLCFQCGESSPERARLKFEEKVKMVGKTKYQNAVRRAMYFRNRMEKAHPEWFRG